MTSKAASILLPLCLSLLACGDGGMEPVPDPWPDRLDLEISDSIGTSTGDSNLVFGAVGDVCFGSRGEILVMDQAAGHVRVFSPEGDYLTTFSGRGEGPGQVSIPLAVARLDDGGIFLLDPGGNSYEIFDDSDFTHVREVALWENNPPQDPRGLDGDFYAGLKFVLEQDDGNLTGVNTLGRFRMGMEDPLVVYFRGEFQVDVADLGAMVKSMLRSVVFTGDRNGRVMYALMSTEIYEVTACDSQGRVLFTVSARMPRCPRSEAEMNEEKALMEQWISRMGGMGGMPVEWTPEPFRWMIVGLGVDDQGRLWVQRGTEEYPVLDVFGTEGEHIFSARFPRPGLDWKFHISSSGILAWNENPPDGVQKVFLVRVP